MTFTNTLINLYIFIILIFSWNILLIEQAFLCFVFVSFFLHQLHQNKCNSCFYFSTNKTNAKNKMGIGRRKYFKYSHIWQKCISLLPAVACARAGMCLLVCLFVYVLLANGLKTRYLQLVYTHTYIHDMRALCVHTSMHIEKHHFMMPTYIHINQLACTAYLWLQTLIDFTVAHINRSQHNRTVTAATKTAVWITNCKQK